MKAVRVNEYGKPVQIEEVQQLNPANDEVLVRVHAASLNPLDAAIAAGYLFYMTTAPLTLGADFSGEVVEVGKDITHVKTGDVVFGVLPFRSGTFSEYAMPKEDEVALKPKSLNHIHAATGPRLCQDQHCRLLRSQRYPELGGASGLRAE